jgi:hypothetical protein
MIVIFFKKLKKMFFVLPKDIIRLLLLNYIHYPDIPNILLVGKVFQVLRENEKEKIYRKYYSKMWFYMKIRNKYPIDKKNRLNVYNVFNKFYQCNKCADFLNIKNQEKHIKTCNLFHEVGYNIYQCKCGLIVRDLNIHIEDCRFLLTMTKIDNIIITESIKRVKCNNCLLICYPWEMFKPHICNIY